MKQVLIFLALFVAFGGTGRAGFNEPEKHWIQSLALDGQLIKLDDGSVWQVRDTDLIRTISWNRFDKIQLIDDRYLVNPARRIKIGITPILPALGRGGLNLAKWRGAELIAADGQYLGLIMYPGDYQSFLNPFGDYGSKFSATSISNSYGKYGGRNAPYSPFNRYTITPPRLKMADRFAYLTLNRGLVPRVDPYELIGYFMN